MSDIEKRSIVLTKDLAKKIDQYALKKHISFSAAIRLSCQQLINNHNSLDSQLNISFTPEEITLIEKISSLSLKSKETILKECFQIAIPLIVEKLAKDKEFISKLNNQI